jgi:G6PDH family F420-dependent oxidoreductase
MRIGFFLATEEFGPDELLAQARAAEEAGFNGLWISDHYHPWNHEQGESPFVWNVLGALSQVTSRGPVTTAVTCPTVRIHPAVMAQAAATTAAMFGDRFRFGVGSGEALNEHILGDAWPEADVRLEMLEEAVELIRELWRGGIVHHRGTHYRVQHARIYTRPESPPPIAISGFGTKAVELAARIGDGYVTTMPDSDLIKRYRSNGGHGLVQAGMKVCWSAEEAEARRTVRRLWPNEGLPGELAQVLPTPEHFEQATELVTEEMLAEAVPCGPDLDRHLAGIQEFADAGADELYIHQIGGPGDDFFGTYAKEILRRFPG